MHRIAARIKAPFGSGAGGLRRAILVQVVESGDRLSYGRSRPERPSAHVREAIEIQVDRPEVVEPIENGAERTWYGIDGPRRRPRTEVSAPPPSVVTPSSSGDADDVVQADPGPPRSPDPGHTTVRDRWREESEERARELAPEGPIAHVPHDAGTAPLDVRDLEERFEMLRVAMTLELGRRIDAALARMEGTFEREIEALRTANREEAKRFRSANGEAFVRIRAADTQELERIRRAIDQGIERLCSVLEDQLDRVWSANDVELERIRSAGADRLAEVHELLTDQLARLRMERPPEPPPPDPDPAPSPRWWRRGPQRSSG
jgi:hypothetical protein